MSSGVKEGNTKECLQRFGNACALSHYLSLFDRIEAGLDWMCIFLLKGSALKADLSGWSGEIVYLCSEKCIYLFIAIATAEISL